MLGSGTTAITPLGVATDGQIPIGSSGADPVLAAITPGDGIDVTNAAGSITIAVDLKANGGLVIDTTELTVDLSASAITGTLAVGDGGTGASTLTDHGILLGSGTDAVTPLGAATNGQLPIGSTGADPVLATITEGEAIDITNAAGAITIACEDATTANKGVTVYSGSTKALAGTDTASAMTPADVAAANAVLARESNQGVAMTAATSGSNGIAVADDDDLDMGSGNFAPYFCGIISDVTPATNIILAQKHDATNGWILTLLTTGYLRTTINAATYDSTATLASIGVVDGANVKILSGITRETDSVAGSVQHYVNGLALGTSVAITAGAPTTVTNAVSLYVLGTSAVRTAGVANTFALFNRCPTAAEVLGLYRNGIAYADKWGSQTAVSSDTVWTGATGSTPPTGWTNAGVGGASTFSIEDLSAVANLDSTTLQFVAGGGATYRSVRKNALTVGKRYRADFAYRFNKVGARGSSYIGTATSTYSLVNTGLAGDGLVVSIEAIADSNANIDFEIGDGDTLQIANLSVYEIGATLCLLPENAQPAPGMWLDSSTNNLHAIYPAAGASLTRPKDSFVIRWVNTWAGTHEAQYLGGINQAMLPPKCCVTSIVGVIAGSTIEDIILGDGSDTDHWVAITSGLAAGTVNFTIANAFSDLTNYKLVADPDANFTGSITWTIRGYIYQ
jgi:hypothetical protein